MIAKPLSVLIGCEESGTVREAFLALGHDAWSCDLKPPRDRSNRHIIGDVRDVMHYGWDLLMVAHPPCTRLCNSGVRWLTEPPKRRQPGYPDQYESWSREEKLAWLWEDLDRGAELFAAVWNAPVPCIAVENPIMHKHAKARMPLDLPKPQIVQPWWFGDPVFKATGLYLFNLPSLRETNRLTPPERGTPEHARWSRIHRASPGPNRSQERSEFFPGIAAAMAEQWGGYAMRAAA